MKSSNKVSVLSVGSIHPTRSCGDVIILKYNRLSNITIKFLETGTILEQVSGSNLRKGLVSDPYKPSLCGVGYVGIGQFNMLSSRKVYWKWCWMISRVYRPSSEKVARNYSDCTVAPIWHNFQNFAEWYYTQPFCENFNYELDKDLLKEGNKVYGPEYCTLIPKELNNAISFCTTNKHGLGVTKEGDRFVAETRSVSADQRRIGKYKTLGEAESAYLKFRYEQIVKLSQILYRNKLITQKHLEAVMNRFDSKQIDRS